MTEETQKDEAARKQAKETAASLADAFETAAEFMKFEAVMNKKEGLGKQFADGLKEAFGEISPILHSKKTEDAIVEKIKREPTITTLETTVLNQGLREAKECLSTMKRANAFAELCNAGGEFMDWLASLDKKGDQTPGERAAQEAQLLKKTEAFIAVLKRYDGEKGAELEARYNALKTDMSADPDKITLEQHLKNLQWLMEGVETFVDAEGPKIEAALDEIPDDEDQTHSGRQPYIS